MADRIPRISDGYGSCHSRRISKAIPVRCPSSRQIENRSAPPHRQKSPLGAGCKSDLWSEGNWLQCTPRLRSSRKNMSEKILSVSELTHAIKAVIEPNFQGIHVKGEISNFKLQ